MVVGRWGRIYIVDRWGLTWLLQEMGFIFLRVCRPPYANYLVYGDSKMRLTCDSMVCIYEISFRTKFT